MKALLLLLSIFIVLLIGKNSALGKTVKHCEDEEGFPCDYGMCHDDFGTSICKRTCELCKCNDTNTLNCFNYMDKCDEKKYELLCPVTCGVAASGCDGSGPPHLPPGGGFEVVEFPDDFDFDELEPDIIDAFTTTSTSNSITTTPNSSGSSPHHWNNYTNSYSIGYNSTSSPNNWPNNITSSVQKWDDWINNTHSSYSASNSTAGPSTRSIYNSTSSPNTSNNNTTSNPQFFSNRASSLQSRNFGLTKKPCNRTGSRQSSNNRIRFRPAAADNTGVECRDEWRSTCRFHKYSCDRENIRQHCRKTCNACTTTTTTTTTTTRAPLKTGPVCEDSWSTCNYFKSSCSQEYISLRCKKTCGKCVVSRQLADSGCSDTGKMCVLYKGSRSGSCSYSSYAKTNCKETCGLCGKKSVQTQRNQVVSPCKDESRVCKFHKSSCSYSSYAKTNCKQTCGLCDRLS